MCVSSKSGPEKEEAKHTSVDSSAFLMMYVHSDERCLLDTDDVQGFAVGGWDTRLIAEV